MQLRRFEHLDGTGWSFRYDDAYPPGTDAFVLSAFPRLRRGERVCDLGCGAGLLGLLLLRREPSLRVTGLERDGAACALGRENAAANGLEERLRICSCDLRRPDLLPAAGSFDLVVSNPPYFTPDSGAAPPDKARRLARTEEGCALPDVCAAAARLLRWGGRFALVYRPERLCDLLCAMREAGLEPKRLRMAQQAASSPPFAVLAEGSRGGRPGLAAEAPLLLTGPDGASTAEAEQIYWKQKEAAP